MAKETAKAKKAREAAEAAAAAANTAPTGLLKSAVDATNSGAPFMATEASMHALLTDPRGALVEFNKGMVNGDKIAFRATALGVQLHTAGYTPMTGAASPGAWGTPGPTNPAPTIPVNPTPAAPSNPPAGKTAATFDDGIAVPAARRGGRGSGVYGFEQMNVGQSFFVPLTTDNPNPAKRIASTVSSASERLAPKKFIVRSVDETAQGRGKGARVWRTADEVAKPA